MDWKKPLKNILSKNPCKSNIFVKYFLLFAIIFLTVLALLGILLTLLVSSYTQNENTKLLVENTQSVAQTVSSNLSISEMNNYYSIEKEMICESLSIISNSIDADIFVCDVEGNIILCRDRSGSYPYFGHAISCEIHDDISIPSALLQRIYQGENYVVEKMQLSSKSYYVAGCAIQKNSEIIGSVFATTQTGFSSLAYTVFRVFLISALLCLLLAFICIYVLTKSMVKPLRQMGTAAKQFAVGDFSYRVQIKGDDELSDLGLAFNEMADALDKLESSRRSFVSNVSHELRTPMTSISGFIDGILDGTIPKEKTDYYLQIVSDEVRRLSRLVVSMLNMSKVESGDFEMKPSKYDIADQIIHILLTFERKIEEKKIQIIGLDDFEATYIVADPDMIYQAIYNIFDNAVKFTNEGGYIKITLKDLGNNIEVSIKNSGSGIKAEELSKVFERFYKIDKSRSLDAKGAGLGLYIVKMMVEMHGGKVRAESENEHSAEFIFTLPKSYKPITTKRRLSDNGRIQ